MLSERFVGETRTEATSVTDTVTVARPTWPSLRAEMIVPPGESAVTRPDELTRRDLRVAAAPRDASTRDRATAGIAWLGREGHAFPDPQRRVRRLDLTLATSAPVTVMSAIPLLPSMLAAIWTPPARRAVTSPDP